MIMTEHHAFIFCPNPALNRIALTTMLSRPSYKELNDLLLPLTLEAGAVIMAIYNSSFEVTEKADESPVTAADQKAEALILEGLAQHFPQIPVVAEEMCAAGAKPKVGSLFFLVDPLDGTKEFIARRGEFTVNIGLIEDGQPVYGIVYAPAINALYVTLARDEAGFAALAPEAGSAGGAKPGLEMAAFQRISCREWPGVSGDAALADAALSSGVALASRSHGSAATEDFLKGHGITRCANSGSSLKFCKLAAGEADVYPRFGPTMEWDTAAGHAVLRAAGGEVVTTEGAPFRYGKGELDFRNGDFIAASRQGLRLLGLDEGRGMRA